MAHLANVTWRVTIDVEVDPVLAADGPAVSHSRLNCALWFLVSATGVGVCDCRPPRNGSRFVGSQSCRRQLSHKPFQCDRRVGKFMSSGKIVTHRGGNRCLELTV
jgi:hypothetical protein